MSALVGPTALLTPYLRYPTSAVGCSATSPSTNGQRTAAWLSTAPPPTFAVAMLGIHAAVRQDAVRRGTPAIAAAVSKTLCQSS